MWPNKIFKYNNFGTKENKIEKDIFLKIKERYKLY